MEGGEGYIGIGGGDKEASVARGWRGCGTDRPTAGIAFSESEAAGSTDSSASRIDGVQTAALWYPADRLSRGEGAEER